MKALAPLLAALALAGCGGGPVEGDLAIFADRVFDGREVIEEGVVVISGDEVVAVGRAAELDLEVERRVEPERLSEPSLLVVRGEVVLEDGEAQVPSG